MARLPSSELQLLQGFLQRSRRAIGLAVQVTVLELQDSEASRLLGVGRTPILTAMLESCPLTERRFGELVEALSSIDTEKALVRQHGLTGPELIFKVKVAEYQVQEFERTVESLDNHHPLQRGFVRKAMVKMVDAVDALLDSLISVTGVGGAIKEFKDALRAFVE